MLDQCWIMERGSKIQGGYRMTKVDGKMVYVHRAAYEAYNGSIPQGYEIDHLCQVRNCYNPRHLEAVTRQENMQRSWERRRARKLGEPCGRGHVYDSKARGQVFCAACDEVLDRGFFREYRKRKRAEAKAQR